MSVPKKSNKSVCFLSENAQLVLERRYLKKDDSGIILETPEQMFRRVAGHIAAAEKLYNEKVDIKDIENQFYQMMTEFRFLPNSPTLMNAGRALGQLAACFVLPVEDSIDGIFDAVKNAATIHKSGGGTGFSFSRLRPENSRVGSTGGVASGPVSFMKIFNSATEQVKQGGTRRGANMAILRVDHPDIISFINCKNNQQELNNFNISVGVTDAFMDAVSNGDDYDLIDPRTNAPSGKLNAPAVYEELVRQAWATGDPGIVFLDEINRHNTTPGIGEMESTNPCGEQPLLPMEACNLGSINLTKFVTVKDGRPTVDYDGLKKTIHLAIRFLDNTIDMSVYPLKEIERIVHGNRKVGLGVMGFADLLFVLNIPYDAPEAIDMAEEIMSFLQSQSHAASSKLAEERGAFPNIGLSVFKGKKTLMRNATTTTIAPTGTLSIIAGCSSGVEPVFALCFERNVMDNDRLFEVNPVFEKVAKDKGFYSEALMEDIILQGTVKGNPEIPVELKKVFVTAHDVAPEVHIKMQAAFQRHTDNAVSKTVNLPNEAGEEDVRLIYDQAFKFKCKGVTVYRDGSKDHQVLSISGSSDSKGGQNDFLSAGRERPNILEGFTEKIKTGMGYLYVTVSEFNHRPFELFATIGKSGKSTQAKTEAIGRLISLALRSGIEVEEIIGQIKGIRGEHAVFQEGGLVHSIPDAISKVLEKRYMPKGNGADKKERRNVLKSNLCPDCSQPIAFEEGCMTCHSCGYTKCG